MSCHFNLSWTSVCSYCVAKIVLPWSYMSTEIYNWKI